LREDSQRLYASFVELKRFSNALGLGRSSDGGVLLMAVGNRPTALLLETHLDVNSSSRMKVLIIGLFFLKIHLETAKVCLTVTTHSSATIKKEFKMFTQCQRQKTAFDIQCEINAAVVLQLHTYR